MRPALVAAALAVLLVPAAAPASQLFLGAELNLELRLDATQMVATAPPRGPSSVPSNVVSPPCHFDPARFEVGPQGDYFRFRDEASEKGCGEARFALQVPQGASEMVVTYWADRIVQQSSQIPNLQYSINFTQDFHVYGEDGQLRARTATFNRSQGTQDLTHRRLAEHVEPGSRLELGWLFQDEARGIDLPRNDVVSQTLVATVRDATVTFMAIPIEPSAVTESRDSQGYAATRRLVTVAVPVAALPAQSMAGHVGVSVHTTGLDLLHVTDPLGVQVPERSLAATSDGRAMTVILAPDAVATRGYGEYVFTFTASEPLQPATSMTVLLLVMLSLPGVMAVLSIRQWVHLRRQAGSSYPHVAQQYLWALLVAQAVYLIVLVWVLVERPFPLLVSWPIEPQAILLVGILIACTAAFFALAFLAKGRLVRLAEADLAAKRRANLELERSNRDLEQFAYVASHDLQEPLRAVAGYTQLLQHRYGDQLDLQARQYIKNAVDGADRMLGLIHGLLAYSRIGTDTTNAAPVDLAVALGEALGNLEAPLRETKARVTHGPLPVVHADRAQAVQLLQNLVANALKFHAPGKPPRIHVEARETGTGEWTVEVADNGIGIPAEHQRRIFQIFQRLHPRERYPGSGLGLAICQRIVERHGGRIWVESRPGQGARFRFTLPKAPPSVGA